MDVSTRAVREAAQKEMGRLAFRLVARSDFCEFDGSYVDYYDISVEDHVVGTLLQAAKDDWRIAFIDGSFIDGEYPTSTEVTHKGSWNSAMRFIRRQVQRAKSRD